MSTKTDRFTISGISVPKKLSPLLIGGILAPLVLIISIITGALLTPNYSHLSETICQLSAKNSAYPGFTIVGFIIYGLLMLGLAIELGRNLESQKYAHLLRISFFIHGLCLMLGGVFRADRAAAVIARTPTGILHNVSIVVGCLAFVFGVFIFAKMTSSNILWRSFARLSLVVLFVAVATFFVALLPALSGIEGLLQRLYSMLSLIWVELVSLRCLLQPGSLDDEIIPLKS